VDFEILSEITEIVTIAGSTGIRDLARLQRRYGSGRWRKLKGIATVMLKDGTFCSLSQ